MVSLLYSFSQGIDDNILAIISTILELLLIVFYIIYKATPENTKIHIFLKAFFQGYKKLKQENKENGKGKGTGEGEGKDGGEKD